MIPLRKNKKLDFYIVDTDCPKPYDVYWKVRNVGLEAIKRNMVRGNICKESGKILAGKSSYTSKVHSYK